MRGRSCGGPLVSHNLWQVFDLVDRDKTSSNDIIAVITGPAGEAAFV